MLIPLPEPSYIPVALVLPLQRLAALVEIIICSGYPSQILLILVLRGFGMHSLTEAGRLSPPFVFTLSLIDAALVVSLVLFVPPGTP